MDWLNVIFGEQALACCISVVWIYLSMLFESHSGMCNPVRKGIRSENAVVKQHILSFILEEFLSCNMFNSHMFVYKFMLVFLSVPVKGLQSH